MTCSPTARSGVSFHLIFDFVEFCVNGVISKMTKNASCSVLWYLPRTVPCKRCALRAKITVRARTVPSSEKQNKYEFTGRTGRERLMQRCVSCKTSARHFLVGIQYRARSRRSECLEGSAGFPASPVPRARSPSRRRARGARPRARAAAAARFRRRIELAVAAGGVVQGWDAPPGSASKRCHLLARASNEPTFVYERYGVE